MDFLQILILALVQGLTEFLPISSSAHLILVPQVLGYADQGLVFDIAIHIGSLLAVILYFRKELAIMLTQYLHAVQSGNWQHPEVKLANLIILSTLPIVVGGALFKVLAATDLRSALVIAITTIGFGLLLGWADSKGKRQINEHQIGIRHAWLIGLAQVLAIIPGTSRSGITMTAGLMLGMTRKAAARYSFLLAIPTILMSGGLVALDLVKQAQSPQWSTLALGISLSFFAALACIHFFLKIIERMGMWPFVLYRLILGGAILLLLI
ncbi:MAG: undecaprenyl-diphosphate phosphatase [gamma proteobacterium symbiont of Bathyaustriella thionipta]|nr:undecaprenyl-diphosphate phosphatase [gamma proteobacterium symbiont of Bathyaustriella thionipta]